MPANEHYANDIIFKGGFKRSWALGHGGRGGLSFAETDLTVPEIIITFLHLYSLMNKEINKYIYIFAPQK